MTTAELVRLLKKNGCKLVSHNSRHDAYYSPITGATVMVGRHNKEEVRTGTLQRILKDAGIKMSMPPRGLLTFFQEVFNMKYVYPAVFTPDGDGFLVDFPDLPHCYTDGDSLQDAFDNAEDALALCLYNLESSKAVIPAPSAPGNISADGGTVVLIKADTLPVRKLNDHRSIRKNVTIPGWMDAIVQEHNGNFSQLLQNAICQAYNLEMA